MDGRLAQLSRWISKKRGWKSVLTIVYWDGERRSFLDVKSLRYIRRGGESYVVIKDSTSDHWIKSRHIQSFSEMFRNPGEEEPFIARGM